jgi:hypothetical protein
MDEVRCMAARRLVLLLLLLAATVPSPARAADDDPWAILAEVQHLDRGPRRWSTRQATLTLTTTGVDDPTPRRVALYQRRSGGETTTAAFVREPAALAGHAWLLVPHGAQPSEMWRFDPARGTAETVTGDALDAPVAGTPLTFRDLDLLTRLWSWTPADADATLNGREAVDSIAAWAIELAPKAAEPPYRKIRLWIGVDDAMVREVHLVGTNIVPERRIRMLGIHDQGAIPWIESLEIDARAPRTQSRISATNVKFNADVPDATFTPAGLAQGAPGS